jgi:hypothetical protein
MTDWRLPEHRRESFLAFYAHHLKYLSHPGCVYAMLPAIAEAFDLDEDGRAWLVWLNGNTQNAVTSYLLLEAAPRPTLWRRAVHFWNDNFKLLEWDTDRRHQKNRFGEATEDWFMGHAFGQGSPSEQWKRVGQEGWDATWRYAFNQPHMGRLSAWSMIEYARILFGHVIPDADSWMLHDKAGSRSHRNGMALLAGYDSTYWDADTADMLGIVDDLERLGDEILEQARAATDFHPDVSRLTMESALCTFKSWRKPNRRYPNVYSDMFYQRIKKAEARFGRHLDLFWDTRRLHLPERLRLEDTPGDPGLCGIKQNWFRETGEIPMLFVDYPHMKSGFDVNVENGVYLRKDPQWT